MVINKYHAFGYFGWWRRLFISHWEHTKVGTLPLTTSGAFVVVVMGWCIYKLINDIFFISQLIIIFWIDK